MRFHRTVALVGLSSLGMMGLVGAATFGLFSSVATSQTNAFTAAQLCLTATRDGGDTTYGPMFYVTTQQGTVGTDTTAAYPTGVWAPGDVHTRELVVQNSCSSPAGVTPSLSAWLTSVSAKVDSATQALNGSTLAKELEVQILAPAPGSTTNFEPVAQAPLEAFLTGSVPLGYGSAYTPNGATKQTNLVADYSGGEQTLEFRVGFHRGADNNYQGLNEIIDFSVNGVQMRNNVPPYTVGTLNQALSAGTFAASLINNIPFPSFGYADNQAVDLTAVTPVSTTGATDVGTITLTTNDPTYSCYNGATAQIYAVGANATYPYDYLVSAADAACTSGPTTFQAVFGK